MLHRDRSLIYGAALLRSTGVGLIGVLLGIYLGQLGVNPGRIGIVIALGMAGGAAATLLVTFGADRLGRRRTLATLAILSAAGGAGLALFTTPWALAWTVSLGMVNGMGRDRGAAFTLEQALLPETAPSEARTRAFAVYHLVLDAGHALGSLLAALPFLLRERLHLEVLDSYRWTFAGYGLLVFLGLPLYLGLSSRVEVAPHLRKKLDRFAEEKKGRCGVAAGTKPEISPDTRSRVMRFAALSGLDALGGGFLIAALMSYWFFQRFGVTEAALAPLFFAARVANALSYPIAAWLSRRIGLVNTMVFTHIPSSVFLMAVPFAPTFSLAALLFLLRESLVEMDVPTRQSYIVAVVRPEERTFASGLTNLTRNVAWAIAPSFAGYIMKWLSLSAPLFLGGGIKILYDLLLFRAFRKVRPPEETPERK
ncbi:MAG: MFS transporter [Acidobacteria bacterium]|nr:MFS transporter [Acidobacteriota bacterium]